jgi:Spy/CpxP family protein refolding chaperone
MIRLWFGVLVTALLVVSTAAAQREQRRDQPRRGDQPGQRFSGGMPVIGRILSDDVLEKLKLTDEQKKKVEQIQNELQDKFQEATAKLREDIQKAFQNMDREARRQATEQMREVMEKAQKIREEFMAKVTAILNEEQKKKFEELKRDLPSFGSGAFRGFGQPPPFGRPGPGQPPFGRFGPPELAKKDLTSTEVQQRLGLSTKQKEKLARLQKKFEEKSLAVLTEEQKKKYEEIKKEEPRRGFGDRPGLRPGGDRPSKPDKPRRQE